MLHKENKSDLGFNNNGEFFSLPLVTFYLTNAKEKIISFDNS